MSKVITFSRVFPAYHPKAGQPTFFVEQIYNSIYTDKSGDWSEAPGTEIDYVIKLNHTIAGRKHHTIRSGNRWKVGDKFSPRVWSGKPYTSPQIIIAPDVKIVKTIDIGLRIRGDFKEFYCNDEDLTGTSLSLIAKNDGLELNDFLNWFTKPFDGQIICWQDCSY